MEATELKRLEMASPIISVAIELGIKVRGSVAPCFREENHAGDASTATLVFNPGKNTFFCRSCPDVGGSVIDLVCQYREWDREEAIEWLAHRAEFDQMTSALYHGKGKKK